MKNPIGSVCLVLHGHLPYVLRHGTWPHGEDWLYEAAAETYMPLVGLVDECVFFNARPRLTVGLTPILLEQLAHEDFKRGFEHYLQDRIERARGDRKDFEALHNGHMAYLATRWEQWYTEQFERFQSWGRDIPKAFADRARQGYFEILTSCATHAYVPLLMEDSSIRAQVRAGVASSQRILGYRPTGMWLPECGYRPAGPWNPPIHWSGKANRIGVEHLVGDEGVTHFFVEHHLIEGSRSEQVLNAGQWWKVNWEEALKYPARGWRSVHEAHGVNSDGTGLARVVAFGRDPDVCQQVWSGAIGYPASGEYLEFHKKWGPKRGLRYWKITGNKVDLGDKHLYYPDDVPHKIHQHAQHFCNFVKSRLWEHRHRTGRHGIVTACFDAELFGHWWFEGPRFLRDVILTFNADPDVELCTAAEYVQRHPNDKVVSLPEGSWGDKGDHSVWANEQVNWMWDIEYRCEGIFGKLTFDLPWREQPRARELLEKAARELLLLQASDWAFMIRRGQAVDYGIKRFMQHVSRFECLADLAEKVASNSAYLGQLNEVERFEVKDADLHDVVFPKIDLNWWNM
jgi:1,4-alpha-glucan branching enzyme